MKAFIQNFGTPATGKGFFMARLYDALKVVGVDVSNKENKTYDVSLHIREVKHNVKSKHKIIRLNGVYFNTAQKWKKRNKEIARGAKTGNAYVYQSKYSKIMCNKYIGKMSGPKTIIFNGANPEYYKDQARDKLQLAAKHNFITFAKWRPQKRLKETIKAFLRANIPNSHLYIAGNISNSGIKKNNVLFSDSRITRLGVLEQGQLAKYLVLCDGMLHLCWLDACPNGVVEAMAAGCCVICNNVGGTPEVVGDKGIICDVDKPFNYKPCDYYHPPKIDLDIVANAIKKVAKDKPKFDSRHIHIDTIAKQYKKFFEECLNGN